MGRASKKRAKLQQQAADLELAKRNGMMRCIVAIICFTVLIIVKLSLTYSGVEWANSVQANGAIFILALVAAGFAGIGSRDWKRAKDQLAAVQQKLRK